MTAPDVSLIVVTHQHRAYVERCFEAIDKVRGEVATEVFLVDNLSKDGTEELVRSRFPWVDVAVRDRRCGFSDNNNHAIRRSKGRYVLVLNPDTEIRPGALRTLVEYMDRNPKVGISGAKLLFPDGSVQPSCRRFPTFTSFLVRRTPLRVFLRGSGANAAHLMLDVSSKEPLDVDWLLGACLFVRREAIAEVGLLDEGYFLYVEDIDWSYRMHQKGWRVVWVPQAEIVHHHQATSDRKLFSWHSWVHFKSMWRFVRKHRGPKFLRLKAEIPV